MELIRKSFAFLFTLMCLFTGSGCTVVAQEVNYNNALPYYGYNENSDNNGTGYSRQTVAMLGVGNSSDSTAINFGNQSQNGSSISGGWEVGPKDNVTLAWQLEGVLNSTKINKVNFEFYYNDAIEIDTSKVPVLTWGNGSSRNLAWGSDLIYNADAKTITASFTPQQLQMTESGYNPAIYIYGQVKEFSVGDYSKIPLNLRITTETTDGANYVSGVCGYFTSKNNLTAQKTARNLTNSSSNKFYEGDTIEYISELNNVVTKPTVDIKNITVEDELPTGFEYNPESLVISKVGVNGEEIITDQVTINENSTSKINFTLDTLEANTQLIVKYQGTIATGVTELTNTVKFIGNQQNVANNPMVATNTIQVNKDLSSLEVKDSSIFVGDSWNKSDNLVSATNKDGEPLSIEDLQVEGVVDTTQAGQYQITYKNGTIEKIATVTVKGKLELNVPSNFDFGTHQLEPGTNYYEPIFSEGETLTVIDRRGVGNGWKLTAKMGSSLMNESGKTLPNSVIYKTENSEQIITQDSAQAIASKQTTEAEDVTNITADWNVQKGILLKVNSNEVSIGKYTGTIEWSLNDAP